MLTLFLVFAVLCPARAERPLAPRPGVYSITGDLHYFQNDRNFSDGGSSRALGSGANFQNAQGTLGGSFDFSKHLRAFASVSFAQTSATSIDRLTFLQNTSRTNTGFNEASLGALAWWNLGLLSLAPQATFVYPFWRVDEASSSPLLGEGAMRLRAGSWAVLRLNLFQPFAYLGYEYRDGGRSSLLPYSAGLHFRIQRWWVQAEIRGTETMAEDGDTNSEDRTTRENYLTDYNGGSFRYYSVNPSLTEAAIETGFRYKGFGVYAGFATTLRGNNSADGNLFYGGVSYSGRVKLAPAKSAPQPEEQFEAEKDEFDESLFEDDKKIKKKVRKQPSVDKLLHETEKELQQE